MRNSHILRSALVGSLLASAASVPAFAQDGGLAIEEIIITAEKREASLQDTAISISAFDGDAMDDLGISGAGDIANYTPGMTYSGSPNRIYVRGVGRQTNELGSEPGVAVYIDGMYSNEATQVSKSTFLVDRIEVLRGPQGTLYGRNSIGGAAAVYTKRPTEEFAGAARITAGNNGLRDLGLSLSGPLTENFRVRLAATKLEGGEYMKNKGGADMNGSGFEVFEAQFDWDISDRLNWWLRFENYDEDRVGRTGVQFDDYNRANPVAGNAICSSAFNPPGIPAAWFGVDFSGGSAFGCDFNLVDFQQLTPNSNYGVAEERPQLKDEFLVNLDEPGRITMSGHRYASHVTFDTEKWQFKYLFGTNSYNWDSVSDYDGTARTDLQYLELIEQNEDTSQHEIQMVSDFGGDIEFIFGGFIYHAENEQPYDLVSPTNPVLQTPYGWDFADLSNVTGTVWLAAPNPDGAFYHQKASLETDAMAIYGQADFFVNDEVHLMAGLRYSKDEKSAREEQRIIFDGQGTYAYLMSEADWTFAGIPFGDPTPSHIALEISPLSSRNISDEWDSLTWAMGIDYKPTDDIMWWAKASTGYKAGGFKLGSLAANPYVEEEKLIAYEIGLKQTINNVFQINASSYFYDYQDQQVPVTAIINGVNHTLFLNAEQSTQAGVEVDAKWLLSENWSLMSTYSYMKTAIDDMGEYVIDGGEACSVDTSPTGCSAGSNLSGNELVKSPNHKFTLNSIHTWNVGDAGEMTFVASYVHMDEQYSTIFNREDTTVPSFDRLDFRLTYDRPDDGLSVALWVRNATDELIVENMGRLGYIWNNSSYATSIQPPRTFGITVDVDF